MRHRCAKHWMRPVVPSMCVTGLTELKKPCIERGAHWRHPANRLDRSFRGSEGWAVITAEPIEMLAAVPRSYYSLYERQFYFKDDLLANNWQDIVAAAAGTTIPFCTHLKGLHSVAARQTGNRSHINVLPVGASERATSGLCGQPWSPKRDDAIHSTERTARTNITLQ